MNRLLCISAMVVCLLFASGCKKKEANEVPAEIPVQPESVPDASAAGGKSMPKKADAAKVIELD